MTDPDPSPVDYEGGFTLERGGPENDFRDAGHVNVRHYAGAPNVAFHFSLSGVDGNGGIYQQLTPGEARELAAALKMGADAADRTAVAA